MKKRKAKAREAPFAPAEIATNFTRGMVAAGLLAAIQDGRMSGKPHSSKLLRQALQGGVALAAGAAVAESMRRQDYFGALAALAGGAIGALALETLLATEMTVATEPAEEIRVG
ncbi:hypothetical protein FLL57_07095 [Rhodopseudomonas palustris]|uniref:hypothetical protein n=1 Tax=Rhodopseudomonas palustris TaxID=1076 RepID=UPI00115E8FDE|nr:hypothetical protein [Rhodopseudomonas palustris]QDL97086.1 hypothetical protein FLL57_07095 [Rhodopseudomonas palustris]